MRLYPSVREHFLTGVDYASWGTTEQFGFITRLVELLASHPRFAIAAKTPGNSSWQDIFRWWIDAEGPVRPPNATRISEWYDYVSTNFGYRFAWGIGCMLAIAANEAHGDILQATTLETWP